MIKLLLRFLAKKYLAKTGVVGLTEGKKVIGGVEIDKKCFKVYVQKKKPLKDIKYDDRIPKKILGFFMTDVEEMAMPKAYIDNKKYRPLQGGCEIGVKNIPFVGTAGNIFYREEVSQGGRFMETVSKLFISDRLKKHFGLTTKPIWFFGTNLHVGAKESVFDSPVGNEIVQPGVSPYIIGEVVDYIPLVKDKVNEFDECLIKLDDSFKINREMIGIGSIYGMKDPLKDMVVHKYGRTTGYTSGAIVMTNFYLNIDFGIDGTIAFKDMVVIKGDDGEFSASGDSGSLISGKTDNFAVARLNSGNGVYSFGIPIKKTMRRLRVWL